MSNCKNCGGQIDVQARIADYCSKCAVFDEYMRRNHPLARRDDSPWRPSSEKPTTKDDLLVINESAEGVYDLCFGYYNPFCGMWSVKVHGKVSYTVYPICWMPIPDGWQEYVKDEQAETHDNN